MPLPSEDVDRVHRWIEDQNEALPAEEVRLEVEVAPRSLTILERRRPWREDIGPEWTTNPVARLRWTGTRGEWDLLWHATDGFHVTEITAPKGMIGRLLVEMGRDEYARFWG